MPGRSSRPVAALSRPVAALTVALVVTLAACDVGDGTTLRDPVAPTTLPPPDTTPLETAPLDDPTLDDPALDDPTLDDAEGVDADSSATDPSLREAAPNGFRAVAPWADSSSIDVLYTCDGANASPAVSWTDVPDGTQELAISLVDNTNLSNGRPFIHWVLAGIDPLAGRVDENATPPGAVRGLNFFGDVGYTGPCPDPGDTNTYTLTVFALGQQLELADGTPAAEVLDLVGTVTIGASGATGTATR